MAAGLNCVVGGLEGRPADGCVGIDQLAQQIDQCRLIARRQRRHEAVLGRAGTVMGGGEQARARHCHREGPAAPVLCLDLASHQAARDQAVDDRPGGRAVQADAFSQGALIDVGEPGDQHETAILSGRQPVIATGIDEYGDGDLVAVTQQETGPAIERADRAGCGAVPFGSLAIGLLARHLDTHCHRARCYGDRKCTVNSHWAIRTGQAVDGMAHSNRVIVVGAGPTGLATALGLVRRGVEALVIEAEPALTHDLRAGTYHPPTVEMLDGLGVGGRLRDIAIQVPQWQIRDRRAGVVAQFDLGLLKDETPYPFRLHCEQHKLTPILLDALRAAGGKVSFATRFDGMTQDETGVRVAVTGPEGAATLDAAFLVGADGGRSQVRKSMQTPFEGFTWPEIFLVASITEDLSRHGYTGNAYIADPDEWAAIFIMPHLGPPGIWRVVFPVDAALPEETVLSDEFVEARLQGFLPRARPFDVPYKSIYRVHQRVAQDFRRSRVLLAGDAAHVNNPLGAMGLNSGIHDAINLVDKLASVLTGQAPIELLDRYVRQRRQTNIDYVQAQSIRNKQLLEERDPAVRQTRLDELRRTAVDPIAAKQFLMRSSMIDSVRKAATIA